MEGTRAVVDRVHDGGMGQKDGATRRRVPRRRRTALFGLIMLMVVMMLMHHITICQPVLVHGPDDSGEGLTQRGQVP